MFRKFDHLSCVSQNVWLGVLTQWLFPLGMKHLHEKSLGGCAAAAVLVIQVLFASTRQRVNLRHQVQQFLKLILHRETIHQKKLLTWVYKSQLCDKIPMVEITGIRISHYNVASYFYLEHWISASSFWNSNVGYLNLKRSLLKSFL